MFNDALHLEMTRIKEAHPIKQPEELKAFKVALSDAGITCTGDLGKKQVYDKMVFALAKFMMGDFQEDAAAAENA
ncbi:hypothetical protein CYMTET_37473 [Cymbomonas tetramitiformis]|uniref:Uncharacterized protein n=1 Tax=Cymbomonas tetramitiformis TaxID=36881 RepID=A0AAE0F671_9CHLO|nr:hypothetical protein CYMTET_37473 [Cymbomonas tetramitiformis]